MFLFISKYNFFLRFETNKILGVESKKCYTVVADQALLYLKFLKMSDWFWIISMKFSMVLYEVHACTCPFWDISNQRFRLLLLKTLNDVMLEKSFKLTFRTPCDEHFIEKILNYKSLKIKIFPETWWSMKSRPLTNKNGLSTFNNSLFILISRGVKTTKHLIQDSVLELCC